MDRCLVCALVALAALAASPASPALADGIAIVGGSPRAIGRAGAATVGDDGGGALLINPAAMARRDTARVQLGIAAIDDAVHWQSNTVGAPRSSGQAGSRLAPLAAAIGAIGHWIIGAGVMTAALSERSLRRPGIMRGDLGAAFDYRYAGIEGSYRRDTLALGAARRIGDTLAVGLSLGVSKVNVAEHRRIWAGLSGRDAVGDPQRDVDVQFDATAWFAASAVAGVLYAPEEAPIELGASVAWSRTVRLDGSAFALGTPPDGPTVIYTGAAGAPRASLEVRQPLVVRAGGRYVGEHVVAELDGDLWAPAAAAGSATWQVNGVRVVDSSQVEVDLRRVPSRIAQHTHVAMRTAVDVELIPGFLWATAGYAFSTLATPAARLSPSFGDLGGHTLGLGLEVTAGSCTVTLGWARTWSLATRAPTALQLDNPFAAGDGPVPGGVYDGSIDQVGILIEGELGRRGPP